MYSCFPTISFLVSYLLQLLTEVEKRPTQGQVEVKDGDGDMTRVVLWGRVAKVIKAMVAKTS